MDEFSATFHFGLLRQFLTWVQTNEKNCEKGFNIISGEQIIFPKSLWWERGESKIITYQ